jgi:hypothetical protein
MKPKSEVSAEYTRFTSLVDCVLSVSREEIADRESKYRAQVDTNENRRGPKRGSKRKPKTSASLDSGVSSPKG